VIRLLVVDDSPLIRRLLGDVFTASGDFEVEFARNGVEALEKLAAFQPDVVTLDVNMPEMDGLTCLDRIMVERPCPVVMVSALTEAGATVTLDALDLGAVDFVAKPERAVSLEIDSLGPRLIEKVRAAAKARIRRTHRLTERVRLRSALRADDRAVRPPPPPRQWPRPAPASLRSGVSLDGAVLVGTSTGGPPALDALLSGLPAEFPWPVVVAQHMPATFTGPLARRLDKLCTLAVVEVTQPMPLTRGTVYIARGDADIIVTMRSTRPVVMAAPSLAEYRWHPSVDRLVSTAMEHIEASQLVGVLMTGMGNDGAREMTRLRAAGGRTIAEAEETAVVWGMPGELVRAGGAEFVAPLDQITDRLMALVGS
jgi:two-component system, chemotaxis family, protein-glutamate methylesterase/glutaminase